MSKLVLELLDWFIQVIIDIFFREVSVRGSFNFPTSGPTIVVIAPHANQYLDAAIAIHAAHMVTGRQVSMIEAASSYYSGWMGIWSRWSGAIPVERQQDRLKPAKGIVKYENYLEDQLTIVGEGTEFTKDCERSGLLGVFGGNVKIGEIISDTKLKLAAPMKKQQGIDSLINGTSFKTAPRIDNSSLFETVFEALHLGRCIGIAPEGGSHDRPELLEFKPGVALMALGAVAKFPDTEISIVPCGLNYFHPNKFRSRAVVEYGTPIIVDQAWAKEYKENARKTVSKLMEEITAAMNIVTTQAPDYQMLQVVQAVRRLYSNGRFDRPPLPVVVEINRNLLTGYNKFRDHPRIQHLKNSVLAYNSKLKTFGLRDHQVETATNKRIRNFALLVRSIFSLLFYSILSLPGTILFSPIFIACSVISKKKQKTALANSVVKIKATDVIASWKVLIALFITPVCYFIYSTIGTYLVISNHMVPYFAQTYSGIGFIFCCCWAMLVGTTYSALKMGEVGMDIYKSIKPLFLSLVTMSDELEKLKEERQRLSMEVTEVINEFGPKVFKKFNEVYLHQSVEEVKLEQEEIKERSRSRSISRSRSRSRSRSASAPLSRTSSNLSGFSSFDGENDEGKLPNLQHVSIFPDYLQLPDTRDVSVSSSFDNLHTLGSASTGVELNALTNKIKQAVIQRNKENEVESENQS